MKKEARSIRVWTVNMYITGEINSRIPELLLRRFLIFAPFQKSQYALV